MNRRHGAMVVAAAVAVLGVGGGVAAASIDWRDPVDAGSQRSMEPFWPLDGRTTAVQLPDGEVAVTVSTARVELPPDREDPDDQADTRAPEDGSFVGVEVVREESVGVGYAIEELREAEVPDPTLTLDVETAGEARSYPLGTVPHDEELRTWVAVDGVPASDEVTLAVEVDGVPQVVDPSRGEVDPGDAEQLYLDPSPTNVTDCEVRAQGPDDVEGDTGFCPTTLLTSPYLPGVGWAPDGRWLVVEVDRPTVTSSRTDDGVRYGYSADRADPSEPAARVTLDDAEPDEVVADGAGGGAAVVAWRVAEDVGAIDGRLRVVRTLTVASSADPDPITSARLTWTTDLPDLR